MNTSNGGALSGKVALVTGGSRGIGRAIVEALAAQGAKVAINYTQSAGHAEELAGRTGGMAIQCDVAGEEAVLEMFDRIVAAWGRLDILVNNAGVAEFKPVVEFTMEEADRIFAVNTRGTFLCMREAAKRISDGGRIINISTGATVASPMGGSVYCGSKAAVEQFTRIMAKELGPRGVTVNTVSPGFTDTDMLRSIPGLMEISASQSPLGRVGEPEDISSVVLFLCGGDGGWITGQNIQAGGGASML